jgi:hypothetical protein
MRSGVKIGGVVGQHLRKSENAGPASQSLRLGVGRNGERLVEVSKARDSNRAPALCQGGERAFEVGAEAEPTSEGTQPDDLGPHRQRRQHLLALQRGRLFRHGREPVMDMALPIVGRLPHREAAQVAQGQRLQSAHPERRRHRRYQAKGQCRGSRASNDPQR